RDSDRTKRDNGQRDHTVGQRGANCDSDGPSELTDTCDDRSGRYQQKQCNQRSEPEPHSTSMAGRVPWLGKPPSAGTSVAPATVTVSRKSGSSKVAGMAYDVARVRGLHPSLGDGWVHFDAPAGMLIPDSVATTVSTAFRRSAAGPASVVLGADRAILLASLAEASSSRAGLGYEVIVSRLDDEANIAPWLRAAHRYGAKVKWAEIDIETGELPTWQWESLIGKSTRLAAVASASATLGTVTDLRAMIKLV